MRHSSRSLFDDTKGRRGSSSRHKSAELATKHRSACPHCGNHTWIRLRRSWLQKWLHRREILCFCPDCRQQFWKDR